MNKDSSKTRYYVQWDTHARHMCTVLCSLMEHQSLIDLAICCGTNTIHAHKCILAANSPYFREQLEKNAGTEQIVINGLDFAIVKSVIEFMYCGETNIYDENLKYMIAAAKFFQIRGLQTLVADHQDLRYEAEAIHIAPPLFLPKKPKYPSAYRPLNNAAMPTSFGPYKGSMQNDPFLQKKVKRKVVRSEAEKACAKEAAASRLALEALQKELASTAQMSSFVIEESCTETTVENFIPHTDETFMDNLNHMDGVPLQVVNYDDLNNSLLTANQMININKGDCTNSALQYRDRNTVSKDKLKRILGTNISGNIEIMYRTPDGNIVNVTTDVLQNLAGDGLQYQIVDENGQIRELQEFQDQNCTQTNYETSQCLASLVDPLTQSSMSDVKPFTGAQTDNYLTTDSHQNDSYLTSTNIELINPIQIVESNQDIKTDVHDKRESNVQPEVVVPYNNNEITTEIGNQIEIDDNLASSENDLINISSSSSSCSEGRVFTDPVLFDSNSQDSVLSEILNKPEQPSIHFEEFNSNNSHPFLNLEDLTEEPKNEDSKENVATLKGQKKRQTLSDALKSEEDSDTSSDDQTVSKSNKRVLTDNLTNSLNILENIDLTGDGMLNTSHEISEQDSNNEYGGGDCSTFKKIKLAEVPDLSEENLFPDSDVQLVEEVSNSQRKTRSSLKTIEDISQTNILEGDEYLAQIKCDKPRRIMPNRKKRSI